jgi:hypothetical protein
MLIEDITDITRTSRLLKSVYRRATDWTARVRFPAWQVFSLHSVQTDSGAHPMGIGGLIPLEVKRQGREADHSPLSSAEVKKGGAVPSLPHAFMALCLIKHRDNFTLLIAYFPVTTY